MQVNKKKALYVLEKMIQTAKIQLLALSYQSTLKSKSHGTLKV